jgi:hypothetical protein
MGARQDIWIPYDVWDVLPIDPVVQPQLLPAVTDLVRERYLYPSGASGSASPTEEPR